MPVKALWNITKPYKTTHQLPSGTPAELGPPKPLGSAALRLDEHLKKVPLEFPSEGCPKPGCRGKWSKPRVSSQDRSVEGVSTHLVFVSTLSPNATGGCCKETWKTS